MDASTNPYAPPALDDANSPAVLATQADQLSAEAAKLRKQGQSGANWFYWIAALSLVNSVIFLCGGEIFFVCGLGVSMMVDAIGGAIASEAPEVAPIARGIAFTINLAVAAVVAGVGLVSTRGNTVVFAIGMVCYAFDAIIFLMLGELMSVGFHAFALWCMWSGWKAMRKYNAFENAVREEALIASPAIT